MMIRWSLGLLCSLLFSVCYAQGDYIQFTTYELAEKHCPAEGTLLFTPSIPSDEKSLGTISGVKDEMLFSSYSSMIHPEKVIPMPTGIVRDTYFTQVGGIFGYKNRSETRCYYTYPTVGGDIKKFPLVHRP